LSLKRVGWQGESKKCQLYVGAVCLISIPLATLCFSARNDFSVSWLLLSIISVFVATVNIRLPKLSSVISMGDVFIILIFIQFGPGPALVTYWADSMAAHTADL